MQDESAPRSNELRTQQMRARLVASARDLFAEKGFSDTGTPEIVRHANVTRGALYHHFVDKTDLFRAVVEAEAESVEKEITASSANAKTPLAALRGGTVAFFQAMSVPGRARILLVDGPAVLGVTEIDRIDAGSGRASLRQGLGNMLPEMPAADLDALSIVLSAAFDRAALAIATGEREEPYTDALVRLVSSLGER